MPIRGADCTAEELASMLPVHACNGRYDAYKAACSVSKEAEEELGRPNDSITTRADVNAHRANLVRLLERMRDCCDGRIEFRERCVCRAYRDVPHDLAIHRAQSTVNMMMNRLDAIAAWYDAHPLSAKDNVHTGSESSDTKTSKKQSKKSTKAKPSRAEEKVNLQDDAAFEAYIEETYASMDANVERAVARIERLVPRFRGDRLSCMLVLKFMHLHMMRAPMRLSRDSYAVGWWDAFLKMLETIQARDIAGYMGQGLNDMLKTVPDRVKDPATYEKQLADLVKDAREHQDVLVWFEIDDEPGPGDVWLTTVDPVEVDVAGIYKDAMDELQKIAGYSASSLRLKDFVMVNIADGKIIESKSMSQKLQKMKRLRSGYWHFAIFLRTHRDPKQR